MIELVITKSEKMEVYNLDGYNRSPDTKRKPEVNLTPIKFMFIQL
jgi:hypothetical protein